MVEVMATVNDVRRDDDLIRTLMVELEADPHPVVFFQPDGDSDADRIRYYHLRLLVDAGFLEETGRHGYNFRITNDGHDFLRMMANEGFWSQVRSKAAEVVPAYGLRLAFEIGNGLMRQKLADLGVPLG